MWNTDGCITESASANVVVTLGGQRYTPPVSSGLLAGTYRRRLLETGDVHEREIRVDELASADSVMLVNSVRGEMPVLLLPADDRARARTY